MRYHAEPVVRLARPTEYERVGEITARVYLRDGFTHPASSYLSTLRDAAGRAATATLLVADLGGDVVGTVTYCPAGSPYAQLAASDEAEFRMLAVSSGARGKGVGAALVRACIDHARAARLTALRLSTQPDMRAAHRIYERLGFGRTPDRDWAPGTGRKLITYALPLCAPGRGVDPDRR